MGDPPGPPSGIITWNMMWKKISKNFVSIFMLLLSKKAVAIIMILLSLVMEVSGILILATNIYPVIAKRITPKLLKAEMTLHKLIGDGSIGPEDSGFDIIVENCIVTLPGYEDLDPNLVDSIGHDIQRSEFEPPQTDPYEWPESIVYDGHRQSLKAIRYRTIEDKFTDYVDRQKDNLAMWFLILGLLPLGVALCNAFRKSGSS